MVNIAHSALTGGDLHESKGTAAAAVDTVFVADGAGSGAYKKVPGAALAGLGNPFGAQLLHLTEEQAPGASSVTTTATSNWFTVALNTVRTNEIAGASLSSNQIVLPVGVYFIDAYVPWNCILNQQASSAKVRLQNFTTSGVIVYGQASVMLGGTGGSGVTTPLALRTRFTLAGTSTLLLQHYKSAGNMGSPFGSGGEVYADALIWKIS